MPEEAVRLEQYSCLGVTEIRGRDEPASAHDAELRLEAGEPVLVQQAAQRGLERRCSSRIYPARDSAGSPRPGASQLCDGPKQLALGDQGGAHRRVGDREGLRHGA